MFFSIVIKELAAAALTLEGLIKLWRKMSILSKKLNKI